MLMFGARWAREVDESASQVFREPTFIAVSRARKKHEEHSNQAEDNKVGAAAGHAVRRLDPKPLS